MNMTQPNRDGSYRIPASRMGEVHLDKESLRGDIANRLGSFESLSLEPEQLKKIVDRYVQYKHLFEKA